MRFYPNIKYIKKNVIHDTTILFKAYNIIAGNSSFIIEIIYFSKKLQKLWIYSGLFYFQLPFIKNKNTIHNVMNASKEYLNAMRPWKNSPNQYNLMINENSNDSKFIVIK